MNPKYRSPDCYNKILIKCPGDSTAVCGARGISIGTKRASTYRGEISLMACPSPSTEEKVEK